MSSKCAPRRYHGASWHYHDPSWGHHVILPLLFALLSPTCQKNKRKTQPSSQHRPRQSRRCLRHLFRAFQKCNKNFQNAKTCFTVSRSRAYLLKPSTNAPRTAPEAHKLSSKCPSRRYHAPPWRYHKPFWGHHVAILPLVLLSPTSSKTAPKMLRHLFRASQKWKKHTKTDGFSMFFASRPSLKILEKCSRNFSRSSQVELKMPILALSWPILALS